MFDIPAMNVTLTAVLLLSGIHHLFQAMRSRQFTGQVNNGLHALMNVVMAAMLWNLLPSMMLAQIVVLAGAALWFLIQAVARTEFTMFCARGQSRLTCLYHSLTMGGAALMVAMMGHTTGVGGGLAPAAGASTAHDHHAMGAAGHSMSAATMDYSPVLASALTVFFGAAAVVFIVLLLRRRDAAAPRHSARWEHGLESVGAAVMSLMFASMAA